MSKQPDFNSTQNEITPAGKFWGGFLLISFTSAAIVFLFAFWPDKVPDIKDVHSEGKYDFKLFSLRLLTTCDSTVSDGKEAVKHGPVKRDAVKTDSVRAADSAGQAALVKGSADSVVSEKTKLPCGCLCYDKKISHRMIDLNTVFLVLVALMGFLGNMIHIATSFTTFIGNGNFKRSWITWYIVKPFTAAALAIIFYLMVRAGFLNNGSDAKDVNLYGILSLAAMTGLFTDIATLKLKEIFETAFRPKDQRDDKLTTFSIDAIVPDTLAKGNNALTLKGKGLDTKKLTIKIDDQDVTNPTVTSDAISFSFTVAATAESPSQVVLVVLDDSKNEIFRKTLTVQ